MSVETQGNASKFPIAMDRVRQTREKKYFARYKEPLAELPNFVETQTQSFKWLLEHGLKELFKEFSPISDYSGKKFDLEFTSFELSDPAYDEYHAKANMLTLEAPLRAKVKLKNKTLNSSK